MRRTSKPDDAPVALVTRASAGIGASTARALPAAGDRVFGTCHNNPQHRIEGVRYRHGDVAGDGSVAAVVAEVRTASQRIDLPVKHVGIGLVAGAEASSVEQAEALFDVNFVGAIRRVQAVPPGMRRPRSGRIVDIRSVLGVIPWPCSARYASTQHAMEGHFESLDHEVRAFGIRTVRVGPADTRAAFEGKLLNADRQLDDDAPARSRAQAHRRQVMQTAESPPTVAAVVMRAAQAERPLLRDTAGRVAQPVRLLRRFVPASAFGKRLRKQLCL